MCLLLLLFIIILFYQLRHWCDKKGALWWFLTSALLFLFLLCCNFYARVVATDDLSVWKQSISLKNKNKNLWGLGVTYCHSGPNVCLFTAISAQTDHSHLSVSFFYCWSFFFSFFFLLLIFITHVLQLYCRRITCLCFVRLILIESETLYLRFWFC